MLNGDLVPISLFSTSVRIFHGIVKFSSSWKQMYTSNSSSYLINRLPIRILNTDQKFQSISQGIPWFGIAPFPRNPFNLCAEIPISSPPCHIPLKCIGISHTNLKHALLTCSFHSTNQPPISQVAELHRCNKSVANFIALTSLPFPRSSCHVSLSIMCITSLGSLDTNQQHGDCKVTIRHFGWNVMEEEKKKKKMKMKSVVHLGNLVPRRPIDRFYW